jgi:hypothetical protein
VSRPDPNERRYATVMLYVLCTVCNVRICLGDLKFHLYTLCPGGFDEKRVQFYAAEIVRIALQPAFPFTETS